MGEYLAKYDRLLISIFLVISTVAIFWHVGGHEFIGGDDTSYLMANPYVNTGMSGPNVAWAFTHARSYNWHPLTWISYMADYSYNWNPLVWIWNTAYPDQAGNTPSAKVHLGNLFWHIVDCVLLFLLLNRMTRRLWPSAFVAALFALYPTHVESVAWASERKDVLSTFFLILTLWAYTRYAERPNVLRYLTVLGLFLCGLMSKPMLVSVPLLLLILDWWPLKRLQKNSEVAAQEAQLATQTPSRLSKSKKKNQPQRQAETVTSVPRPVATPTLLIVEKIPFCVLAFASCVATYLIQQRTGAMRVLATLPAGVRAANAIVAYSSYLGKLFWPVHLYYPYVHPERSIPHAAVIGSLVGVIAITVAIALIRRRFPYVLMGWLWYMLALLPVIGFVQVGPQAMADRYTYVPFVGLFVAITWLIADLGSRFAQAPSGRQARKNGEQFVVNIPLTAAACVVLVLLAPLTYKQVDYWHDVMSLYNHSIDCDPNDYIALTSTVAVLDSQGKTAEALARARRAVQAKLDYPVSRDNLASLLLRTGHYNEGIEQCMVSLKYRPDDGMAVQNLALAYYCKGMYAESWKQVHRARDIKFDVQQGFVDALSAKMLDPEN